MSTTPSMPTKPYMDAQGNPTENFEKWLKDLWLQAGSPNNKITRNVNSGVARAQATAAAAQASADANASAIANTNQQVAAGGTVPGFEMSASASPSSASGTVPVSGSAQTNLVEVTPAGGVGPYTYAWAFESGGTTLTIDSDTSASTRFTGSVNQGEIVSDTAICTVTDSTPGTPLVASVYVGVTISSLSA